jgi:hypothetical protein
MSYRQLDSGRKSAQQVHISFKTPSGVPMTNVMRRWALPLAIVLLAGAACGRLAPEQTLPEMSLKKVSGTVEIIRGGDTITVGEETDIEPDDAIRTSGRDALAKLRLEGDRLLELKGRGSTVVDSPTSVEVQTGQVLVRAEEVTRVLVDSVEASASAAQFRVDRGFGSARVSSYSGTVAVESPGQQRLDIGSFFEATVTAGEIPQSARPYRMQPDDPWDALILQKWVSLEEELKVLSNSLTNNLGGDRPGIAYFSELAGDEGAGFVRSFLDRRVADLLIGFTIANNSDSSLKQAFRRAFSLFDEGATWGITSAIMEIEPRPLLAQLGRTILGTGVVVAGGAQTGGAIFSVAAADLSASGGGIQPPASGGGTTSPGDSPGVSGGGGGNPGGGDPGGGNPGGGGGGGEEPKECQTGDVQCTIDDLTDPSPEPSPSILDLDLDLDDGVLD